MRRFGTAAAVSFVLASLVGGSAVTATATAVSSIPWAWGLNNFGFFGNGTTTNTSTPVQMNGLSGATSISAGNFHSLALKSDSTVWASGLNSSGQLGNGTTTNSSTPVQVSGLSGVAQIEGGYYHSLALKSDGTVWAWGSNAYGQLGNGTTTNTSTPVPVSGLSGFVHEIAANGYSSLAQKSDGTVWGWGSNSSGQLGNGSLIDSHTPVQVSGLSGAIGFAGAASHTLAGKSDGTVWAWGDNSSGQLGNGTTTNSSTPVQVSGLSGQTYITAGFHYSQALKLDGTVLAWGLNDHGQLGNGTTTNSSTPVQVGGLTGVAQIAGGYDHSLARKSDGTVWAWGDNLYGELGNGTTTTSGCFCIDVPGQVIGLSGALAISAGFHYSLALNPMGLLRVVSSPAQPTQILVDGNIADSWGLVWMKESAGAHTVCFTHVAGWTEPPCQTVMVNSGATTTLTGTFTQRGTLRVITSPAVPSQIKVDGNPTNDWGMWTDIPTGPHTVCYGAVAGYNSPACQAVAVSAGAQTTVTGTFTSNPSAVGQSGVGFLRVTTPVVPSQITITPSAGSPHIADTWGLNWLELPPGSYTVSFSHVVSYTEPAPQTVTVTAGATTTVTGTFNYRGFLRVLTSPAVAGTIFVDGIPRNDWGMWTDIFPAGSHTVCFGAAPGFANTPACQTVTVNPGATTTVTGNYS